jgi:hypothetical protein
MQVTFDKIKVGQMFKYAKANDQTSVFLKDREWDGVEVRAKVIIGPNAGRDYLISYWRDTFYTLVEPTDFKEVEVIKEFTFKNGIVATLVGDIVKTTGGGLFPPADIERLRQALEGVTLGGFQNVRSLGMMQIGCRTFDRDELKEAIKWYDENKSLTN